ncbi:hypothetical protein [Candidatus Palauibacter sp.]|uniref:hypothetical protein n=1 Tax=Candidatus Palauibacter sp. TaxID=3101350 RepID=UPI003B590A99
MVHVPGIWLPILLAAGLVFVASSVIHTVLNYHRTDFGSVPDEDGVMDALLEFEIPPGDYSFPHPTDKEMLKSEAFREKATRGPTGFMTLLPSGDPFNMGRQLVQWFIYCIVVSLFAGYVTGLALGPGTAYMEVFRMSSTVAFGGYGLAHMQRSIWYSQAWGTTARNMLDGAVYGLLTGGAFGWLWPA